jgi:hypothetical protein
MLFHFMAELLKKAFILSSYIFSNLLKSLSKMSEFPSFFSSNNNIMQFLRIHKMFFLISSNKKFSLTKVLLIILSVFFVKTFWAKKIIGANLIGLQISRHLFLLLLIFFLAFYFFQFTFSFLRRRTRNFLKFLLWKIFMLVSFYFLEL